MIAEATRDLERHVRNAKEGLPEEVFLFVSRMTPMVNVDLLIKDDLNRTLLAWRDDEHCGMGWHVPGGTVRFKETMRTRLKKVAETEIGAALEIDPTPIEINELIVEQETRGHYISFLHRCFLPSSFVPPNTGLRETDPGFLRWHDGCPANLLAAQALYRKHIDVPPLRG